MDEHEHGGAAGAETPGIGATAAAGRERRLTARRKREAVPRVLRDEPLELVARLATARGQSFLFGASQRLVVGLNETAGEIWRGLDRAETVENIVDRLVRRGADRLAARDHVSAALSEWEKLGLIHPSPHAAASCGDRVVQLARIADLGIRISYPARSADPARSVFQHLEAPGGAADLEFSLIDRGDQLHLFRNGEWRLSCSTEELPTMLKGRILAEVLEQGGYELALHAASLACGERALLLCGAPGAGKTTLTVALSSAGFGFMGDDVTLLTGPRECIGIPFAPAVKAGAWDLLADRCRGLAAAPVFRRPDGQRVRYPAPCSISRDQPQRIGWVFLLNRTSGRAASLRPLEPLEALPKLIDGSFARDLELSDAAFRIVIDLIDTVDVCELTYSRLDDAIALVGERCR